MSLVVQNRQPDFLDKGAAQTVSILIQENGVEKTPSAGTYTLVDADGTAVTGLSAQAATTLTPTVTFDIGAALLDSESFSSEYKSRWALTIDGVVRTYEIEALICNLVPYASFTRNDLERSLSELRGDYNIPDGKNPQDWIDEAFDEMIAGGLARGVSMHQVTSWYAWRPLLKRMSMFNAAQDLMVTRSGASKWERLYTDLGDVAENPLSVMAAWGTLAYRMDRDEDGTPDTDGASEGKPGSFVEDASAPVWRGF